MAIANGQITITQLNTPQIILPQDAVFIPVSYLGAPLNAVNMDILPLVYQNGFDVSNRWTISYDSAKSTGVT